MFYNARIQRICCKCGFWTSYTKANALRNPVKINGGTADRCTTPQLFFFVIIVAYPRKNAVSQKLTPYLLRGGYSPRPHCASCFSFLPAPGGGGVRYPKFFHEGRGYFLISLASVSGFPTMGWCCQMWRERGYPVAGPCSQRRSHWPSWRTSVGSSCPRLSFIIVHLLPGHPQLHTHNFV